MRWPCRSGRCSAGEPLASARCTESPDDLLDLARIGRSRKVVLAVPQFGSLRALLRNTELIATVPDYAACALVEDSCLRADPAPFEITEAELSMVWSGAQDNDPAERWLRERIMQFMASQP